MVLTLVGLAVAVLVTFQALHASTSLEPLPPINLQAPPTNPTTKVLPQPAAAEDRLERGGRGGSTEHETPSDDHGDGDGFGEDGYDDSDDNKDSDDGGGDGTDN